MIEHAPKSKLKMSYEEAVLYCFFYEYKGKRDWRLPTFNEYMDTARLSQSIWFTPDSATPRYDPDYYVQPVRTINNYNVFAKVVVLFKELYAALRYSKLHY